ncbi:hypothetical protein A2U01_0078652, partial [Trifolium medium]|nr:hypothetical protein [Trifolium medium]
RCSVLVRWCDRPWLRDTTTFPPFKGGSSSRRRGLLALFIRDFACSVIAGSLQRWLQQNTRYEICVGGVCHCDTAGSSVTGGWKIRRNRMG